MILKEIIEKLNLKVYNEVNMDADVKSAYSSDLLSDVMGNAKSGQVWITMQTHKNVASIAALKDVPAVIIVRNGVPDDDMLEFAKDNDVAVLSSSEPTFPLCGKLYELIK
ncbi:MAG: serine kinase [Bacteroidales bacterium]|jgi:serine kinase of HPr protein (carbohydrate metabolism regulator)|nr:serine kinase [Bacteroidales bacterium]MBQ1731147.1 serine kinase [Bacteroidales bacterium]MBQ6275829.1 serine kinase [Bacteroidales bacterium]MBR3799217.1 serine kinase [Bacteroidales bacterium]MBR6066511.1 serine kinase [Bacteroidales bacterium]